MHRVTTEWEEQGENNNPTQNTMKYSKNEYYGDPNIKWETLQNNHRNKVKCII